MQIVIRTDSDWKWLREVHGIKRRRTAMAIIHGNEDCPNKVEVYAVDDYRCVPIVYVNVDGNLQEQTP